MKVDTYRNIAKMLASALPIEDDDYRQAVENCLAGIKRLPQNAKVALRAAYIFSRKVPAQEREDLFQELALAILEAKVEDERLAYAIARCDWQNWWRDYMRHSQFYGGTLDRVVEDEDGQEVTFSELLVGEVDFERRMNGRLDAERIYSQLPDIIKAVVNKRLIGKPLQAKERMALMRYVKSRPTILVS